MVFIVLSFRFPCLLADFAGARRILMPCAARALRSWPGRRALLRAVFAVLGSLLVAERMGGYGPFPSRLPTPGMELAWIVGGACGAPYSHGHMDSMPEPFHTSISWYGLAARPQHADGDYGTDCFRLGCFRTDSHWIPGGV